MDELQKWREEFPILNRTNYLNSQSPGAMPRGSAEDTSGSNGPRASSTTCSGASAWASDTGRSYQYAAFCPVVGAVTDGPPGWSVVSR